jgi:hypothetical protein
MGGTKSQAPNNKQAPMRRCPISKHVCFLKLGAWDLFGIWSLGFVI